MRRDDANLYVDYWHLIADLDFLGIDLAKLGTVEETRRRFQALVDGPRPRQTLGFTITVDDQPAGFINVNVLGRPFGVPHFHLADPAARGLGIMSAVLNAGLPAILHVVRAEAAADGLRVEVRTRNGGMNRVLQRLGYPPTRTVDLDEPDGLAGPGTFHIYEIRR